MASSLPIARGFALSAALAALGFFCRHSAATALYTPPPGTSGPGGVVMFEAGRTVFMEVGLFLVILGGLAFLFALCPWLTPVSTSAS